MSQPRVTRKFGSGKPVVHSFESNCKRYGYTFARTISRPALEADFIAFVEGGICDIASLRRHLEFTGTPSELARYLGVPLTFLTGDKRFALLFAQGALEFWELRRDRIEEYGR